MKLMVLDPELTRELIRERRRLGIDFLDEVWDGVYVMSPEADIEHQKIGTRFASALDQALAGLPSADVFARVNVSDRSVNWRRNFRVPDVAVFLPGNPAQARGTHWFGGPDFAAEIISRHDRSRKKLAFYAKVGVRELLLVDRKPWALELYRLQNGVLNLVGQLNPGDPGMLTSQVLPVTFRLLAGSPRPQIEVTRSSGAQQWLI
jgi:Uma2 family endonuclease